MQKIIAIQANSVDLINIETDTTLQLALEAQKRSYQILLKILIAIKLKTKQTTY